MCGLASSAYGDVYDSGGGHAGLLDLGGLDARAVRGIVAHNLAVLQVSCGRMGASATRVTIKAVLKPAGASNRKNKNNKVWLHAESRQQWRWEAMTCCRVQLEGAGAVKGLVPVVAGTGGAVHRVLGKDAAAKRGSGVLQAGRQGVLYGRAQHPLMLLAGELA